MSASQSRWERFVSGLGTRSNETGGHAEVNRPNIQDDAMLNILDRHAPAKVEPLFSEAHVLDARRAKAWLQDRLMKSGKLPASELISEVVNITPAAAEVILSGHNRGNRAVRERKVQQWCDAIRDGRWKLTSQGISFSREGLLNNGQHRLSGIVRAGKPCQMMVVFGEDRSVFDVLDTGAARGGGDTLHVAGYKNTATLAAAARLLKQIEAGAPAANQSVSNDLIRHFVEAHPRLEDASTPGHRIAARMRTSAAAATVAFHLIGENSAFNRRLEFFIDRLSDGAGLQKRDPILVLRDALTRREIPTGKGSGGAAQVAAAIIKTWNLWARGKKASIANLRWAPGETFPKPE